MELLLEALIALLASIGIWAIGGMLYDFVMNDKVVYTLVCACDDADGFDQTINWLVRRHNVGNILVADCGLSEKGRVTVYKIVQKHGRILLFPQNHDENDVKEATIWMNSDSLMK